MNAKERLDILADALTTPAHGVRCKCNPLGPVRPVGVAVDGNGRTTTCPICNGRGWIKPDWSRFEEPKDAA